MSAKFSAKQNDKLPPTGDKLSDKQNDKLPPPRNYRITPRELQEWMDKHRLTQLDLAKLVGRSRQSVNSWLSGQFRAPYDLYDLLCAFGPPWVPQHKIGGVPRDRAFDLDRHTAIYRPEETAALPTAPPKAKKPTKCEECGASLLPSGRCAFCTPMATPQAAPPEDYEIDPVSGQLVYYEDD